MNSLKEIGKFRVVPVSDLAKYAYGGNRQRMEKDIRALARQSLLRDKTLETSQKEDVASCHAYESRAPPSQKTNQVPDDQPIYYRLDENPAKSNTTPIFYRLYQKEAARIERAGGRPIRVLLRL